MTTETNCSHDNISCGHRQRRKNVVLAIYHAEHRQQTKCSLDPDSINLSCSQCNKFFCSVFERENVHTNSLSCIVHSDRKKSYYLKLLIHTLQPTIVECDSKHSDIVVDISHYFTLFLIINISLTTCFHSWRWIFEQFCLNTRILKNNLV